ncbi:pyridoxal-dependent decarboxylase, exosortase A system-associated [Uliginosibacterium sp. H3]|uniref:Pyridoxal-dependent decarboxylase, exosortase A system-associated n=1 Tax=Uliginosibacterium silvisoli TaxID=3114758 RepID=A0ABU6K655_9RHOO|nr:pyridoxal-dependent decarboxylase, exosortase A system-associated [Uliginosibacterium sp. H3]
MSTARPVHAPLTQFPFEHGEPVIGGTPLSQLVAQVGRTPFYAYDQQAIAQRVAHLRTSLPTGIHLHYAMKANPLLGLVAQMAMLVDGLDVASAGELRTALAAGAHPQRISFAGPGKRDAELEEAVAAGILLNVESFREARTLAQISARQGKAARVAVRVNPDFELKSSGMKMSGGPKPFGVDAEQVPALLAEIGQMGLGFEGFHIFAGSQNLRAAAIIEAQQLSYQLALRLADSAPSAVKSLNLGGGFGIPYFPGEQRLDLPPIADALHAIADDAHVRMPDAQLVLELGRYLVGEAGVYVTRIVDRKQSRGQTFLVVDGGLHHHLAASGNFGQVIRKNYPVTIHPARPDLGATAGSAEVVSVVGPLCTPLDMLADQIESPYAGQVGDLVVVYQSGAYGASASPAAFLSHPATLEALLP